MKRRILLLMPAFYCIEMKVINVLETLGYEVVYIENKIIPWDYHGRYAWFRILRRIYFGLFAPQKKYVKEQLKKINSNKFDLLFSINCHIVCSFLFRKLKAINPDLFSVLYLWDSSAMYDWEKESRYFDRVFSFDLGDSKRFGYTYLSNFYVGKNLPRSCNELDLIFIGKFTPDRFRTIDFLEKKLNDFNISTLLRLWPAYRSPFDIKLIYFFLKIIRIRTKAIEDYMFSFEVKEGLINREFLVRETIKYEEYQQKTEDSNVVLDLPYNEQEGSSHRLIEGLARGKKILTTNKAVTNETFFNPEQIKIIDPLNLDFDVNWIKVQSDFTVNESVRSLELHAWLKTILA